jgi:nickel-dependent lactate racemase
MGSQDEMTYSVPYGRGSVSFRLPEGVSGEMARSGQLPPMADPAAAAREAVRKPIGTLPLRELARGKRNVVIAVTDATRACPDHLLVPPMLEELAAAGVPDDAINLLVAVGMHRASTEAEKREKLGDAIVDRYRIVDHNGSDRDQLAFVIDGPGGTPFYVNRLAVDADLLLATGRVEPHQYGGYSGGGKGVAIGCAGEEIIAYTHGPAMLDLPGTRLAALEGNPFQEAVRRVAKAVGLAFVGNIVMDDEERPVAIAYGAPEAVQNHLAEIAGKLYTAPIPGQFDIAVAGVGYPKDANLYQASRAASYLQFAPTPVVRSGGAIVLPAPCPEGAGEGIGERRFFSAMSAPGGPAAVIERARRDGIRPGEQRANVMARVLEYIAVIVAGSERPEIAEAMGIRTAPTIETALDLALEIAGSPARALVVPHALLTLPIVQNEPIAAAGSRAERVASS